MSGFDKFPSRAKLFIFFIFLIALITAACLPRPDESFLGTELSARNPATPFELRDQFGRSLGLSDLDKDVVLLTFLYTNCPDVCPITTSQIRDAHEMLEEDADDVAFVAISVDPARDTVDAAHDYSERWKMNENWSFLVGTEEELEPVWDAYFIDPAINERSRETVAIQNPSESVFPDRRGGVSGLRQDILERYLIIHSSPVYLIDRERTMRVVFTLPFDPEDLVHDVRLLMGESVDRNHSAGTTIANEKP